MLTVAVAQFNAVVGDLAGNAACIADLAARARAQGADVLLTPELALCGYPPEDLLLREDFYAACDAALDVLAAKVPGIALVVGHPLAADGRRYNAATVLADGRRVATYRKFRLPNYEVFDEERYFDSGSEPCVVELGGVRCGLNICADVWEAGAAEEAKKAGAELLLVLNASPCHLGKQALRAEVLGERIATTGIPAVYCNLVGGQDELVFDGASDASHPQMCGLIEVAALENQRNEERSSRGEERSSRGSATQFAGSSRPQRGPIAAGSRGAEMPQIARPDAAFTPLAAEAPKSTVPRWPLSPPVETQRSNGHARP